MRINLINKLKIDNKIIIENFEILNFIRTDIYSQLITANNRSDYLVSKIIISHCWSQINQYTRAIRSGQGWADTTSKPNPVLRS